MKIDNSNYQINSKKINFFFEGKPFDGYENETISSALIRNNITEFRNNKNKSKSIFCNMGVCNECLVKISDDEIVNACSSLLRENIHIQKTNYQNSLSSQKSLLFKKNKHQFDLLVIGLGPGGIGAISQLSNEKINFAAIDERDSLGGQYFKKIGTIFKVNNFKALDDQAQQSFKINEKLKNSNNIFLSTKVWGVFKHDTHYEVCASQGDKEIRFFVKKIILATGSFEKPFFFEGWDLNQVMTTGAAQIMCKSQMVFPGTKAIVAGNGPLNFQLAYELVKSGIKVQCLLESSTHFLKKPISSIFAFLLSPKIFMKGIIYFLFLKKKNVQIYFESNLQKITNQNSSKAVTISNNKNNSIEIPDIDTVCFNYGFIPNNQIAQLLGLELDFNFQKKIFTVKKNIFNQSSNPDIFVVGEASNNSGSEVAIIEGKLVGNFFSKKTIIKYIKNILYSIILYKNKLFQHFLWKIFYRDHSNIQNINDQTVICRCENINLKQINEVTQNRIPDAGLIKRMTRLGMGLCQGKYCNYGLLELYSNKDQDIREINFVAQNPINPIQLGRIAEEKKEWLDYKSDILPNIARSINSNNRQKQHKRCKFTIIGAGIMGVSTAFHISKKNQDICIIDTGAVNSQASGSNAGSLHVQLLSYDFDRSNMKLINNLKNFLKLQKNATRAWKDIETETSGNFEMSTDGGLMLAESESDLEKLKYKIDLENQCGVETSIINRDQIYQMCPLISDKINFAGFCKEEGKINPLVATNHIFEYLIKKKNITAFLKNHVNNISKKNNHYIVETDQVIIETDYLINATGSWSNNINRHLGEEIYLRSIPQQMIVTEPVEYKLKYLIAHIGRHLTLKQTKNGNFLIGGGWTAKYSKELNRPQAMLDSLEGNAWVASHVIPRLQSLKLLRSWGSMSVDIGGGARIKNFENSKNFYNIVSSNGYTLGPLLGKILADEIFDNIKNPYLMDSI